MGASEEIDWNKVYATRIGACCSKAAADCNLSVEVPFVLHHGNSEQETFIAHFPAIGPEKGILLCLASEWDRLQEVAGALGYMCVGLYPEHYNRYDREQWEKNIKEWSS